jgi:hypothetical protein
MIVEVKRLKDNGVQTIGELRVFEEGIEIFSCKTLELPWRENRREVSCIPEGEYVLKHRQSKKYGKHLHIKHVPGRSYILIHSANYFHQLLGCIAVGRKFMYLDNDDQIDVNASRDTLRDIVSLLDEDETHKLIIKDAIKMDKKQIAESFKVGLKEGVKSFSLNLKKNKEDDKLNKKGRVNKPRLLGIIITQIAKSILAYKGVEFIAPDQVGAIVNSILGLF